MTFDGIGHETYFGVSIRVQLYGTQIETRVGMSRVARQVAGGGPAHGTAF